MSGRTDKDLIGSNLMILGSTVVDNKTNICGRNIKAKELELRGPIKSANANPVEICSDVVMKGDLVVNGTVTSHTCPPQQSIANVTYESRTDVTGYGGVNLKAYTIKSGNSGKNILFIAGFSHSNLMWKNQFLDGNLITQHNIYAYDWRSQGESDRPPVTGLGPADTVYAPGENLADDLDAVITTLGIAPCVVVAHSYGNASLNEYIRKYGTGSLDGIVKCAGEALTTNVHLGSGLTAQVLAAAPLITSPNLNDNVRGWSQFINYSSACTFDESTRDTFLTTNSLPPSIVGALLSFIPGPRGGPEPADNNALYASFDKPTLLVQGSVDGVVKPGEAQLLEAKLLAVSSIVPTLKIYSDIGHLFPLEAAVQFNADLLTWLGTF